MVMEEVWDIAKRDLLVLNYYPSFADFKNKVSIYFRTKRFNLNMRNFLLRGAIQRTYANWYILNEEQIASSDKVLKVLKVLADEKQIVDTKNTINESFNLPNYKYTVEDIENFFASDNDKQEIMVQRIVFANR